MSADLTNFEAVRERKSLLDALTPEMARKLAENLRRQGPSKEQGVKAFRAGQTAKREGWARISPYYNKPYLDACWYAGYDGKKLNA